MRKTKTACSGKSDHICLSVFETYLHAIIISQFYNCLPVWSLKTNEIHEPIVRLYIRVYKIHCRLCLEAPASEPERKRKSAESELGLDFEHKEHLKIVVD